MIMADLDRFQAYMDEMLLLQGRIGDPLFIRRFEVQLFDLLASGQIQQTEIELILQEMDMLFDAEFVEFQGRFETGYNEVLSLVNDKYSDIGGDISREVQQMRRIEITNEMQLGEYTETTRQAIKQTIEAGIREEKSVAELEAEIADVNSRAAFYAETLTRTHLMRYGRIGKFEKALIAGVDIFAYLGVLRDTTRPFCRALLHGRYKIADIERFTNGNLEPVIENCGGWNCIHDWEPDPTATDNEVVTGPLIDLDESPGATVIINNPANLEAA